MIRNVCCKLWVENSYRWCLLVDILFLLSPFLCCQYSSFLSVSPFICLRGLRKSLCSSSRCCLAPVWSFSAQFWLCSIIPPSTKFNNSIFGFCSYPMFWMAVSRISFQFIIATVWTVILCFASFIIFFGLFSGIGPIFYRIICTHFACLICDYVWFFLFHKHLHSTIYSFLICGFTLSFSYPIICFISLFLIAVFRFSVPK